MTEEQNKLGAFPYIIGGISFIPLIGIPFGIISIIWGLLTKKSGGKKLAIMGGCGIALTVALYSSLFYFGFAQRGGVYDDLRVQLSKSKLTSLVQAIEYYKVANGSYPENLEVLKSSLPENSMVFIFDPTNMDMSGKPLLYHYELTSSSQYYLLGIGPDKVPFTADDILPDINISENSNLGLVIHESSQQNL